jgi:hypothetical protein
MRNARRIDENVLLTDRVATSFKFQVEETGKSEKVLRKTANLFSKLEVNWKIP